jgi:hypothetical protein
MLRGWAYDGAKNSGLRLSWFLLLLLLLLLLALSSP